MSRFSSLIIGEIAQDTNVDYDGTVVQAIGGAVYFSGFAAAGMGHKTAVLLPRRVRDSFDYKAVIESRDFHLWSPAYQEFVDADEAIRKEGEQ